MKRLNLSKYTTEIVSSIADSKIKLSDIPFIVQVLYVYLLFGCSFQFCSEMHQRYHDFSPNLQTALTRIIFDIPQDAVSSSTPYQLQTLVGLTTTLISKHTSAPSGETPESTTPTTTANTNAVTAIVNTVTSALQQNPSSALVACMCSKKIFIFFFHSSFYSSSKRIQAYGRAISYVSIFHVRSD